MSSDGGDCAPLVCPPLDEVAVNMLDARGAPGCAPLVRQPLGGVAVNTIHARRAPGKKRGMGKQKQRAASSLAASNSLRTSLPALNKAARAVTLSGTVDGHQGASHNAAVVSLVCVNGRIPPQPGRRGGRIATERVQEACGTPMEVFVMSNSHSFLSARATASILRGATAELERGEPVHTESLPSPPRSFHAVPANGTDDQVLAALGFAQGGEAATSASELKIRADTNGGHQRQGKQSTEGQTARQSASSSFDHVCFLASYRPLVRLRPP